MSLHELLSEPELDEPVLVIALDGWIDAGAGAAGARTALLGGVRSEVIARFDQDALIDFRARRPTMRIIDGVLSSLDWPSIELRAGDDGLGHDVLVLTGPEPDMRWHAFCDEVVSLSIQLGARMAVGLGAFPSPVPHTRPVRLVATATTPALAAAVGFMPGAIDVPTGIGGAIEDRFGSVGLPAVGLWARVPHYIANVPYPAASAALLDGLRRVGGISVDTSELDASAGATRQRIDGLIAASDEHGGILTGLEAQWDAEERPTDLGPIDGSDLPSGDQLAAELERFLRGEPS